MTTDTKLKVTIHNAAVQFTPIPSDFDTSDEATTAADEADQVLSDLKNLRKKAAELHNLSNELYMKSWNNAFRGAHNTADVLSENDVAEKIDDALAVIDVQIAMYQKFFKDCEDSAYDLRQQERDEEQYGSYEQQAASYNRN